MNSEIKNLEDSEKLEEKNNSLFLKISKVVLAFLLVLTMLYFSGVREYFFFRKTPTEVSLSEMDKVIDVETKSVPVNLLITRESALGSNRDEENAISMVKNSSQILTQAGIDLEINKINELKLNREEVSNLIEGDLSFLDIDNKVINIVLVKTLGDLNGLAYPNKKLIIMPDYLAGRDYRTLTHEIGHIFYLTHKNDSRQVMSQGSTGVLFSKEEVIKIREKLNEDF
ncbi:MAG: hypothetical protein ACQEP3_02955 [Patescibacteria group bacterium]